MNDETLLHILNQNPQRGMTQLVEQYTGLVWKVISLHLRNPENIKECTNDTFAEFYFHRDRFDPERSSLAVWLTAIARNLAISRFRKERKLQDEPLPSVLPSALLADQTDEIALAEIRADLERAMDTLRPDELQIIRMRYYNGMTVREIADSLELPYETVKKRHQRGIAKLRRTLFLTVLILLALLTTACSTYVVLRHFDIIPPIFSWEKQEPEEEPEDKPSNEDKTDDVPGYIPGQSHKDSLPEQNNNSTPAATEDSSDTSLPVESESIDLSRFTLTAHGINQNTGTPVYSLKENVVTESELLVISLDQANYLNNNLVLKTTITSKSGQLRDVFSITGLDYKLCYKEQAWTPDNTVGGNEVNYTINREFDFFDVVLPTSEENELELSFYLFGITVNFTLTATPEDTLSTYPVQAESEGGLLAVPRLENDSLYVAIYPLNGDTYTIQPGLIYGALGETEDGVITLTGTDGTVITGDCIGYSFLTSATYYDWDFGEVPPGEYTLHIPYVYVTAPISDEFSIPVNLADMTWEDTVYSIPGGNIWIESCEFLPMDSEEVKRETYGVKPEYIRSNYWKIRLRYESDSDLFSIIAPYIGAACDRLSLPPEAFYNPNNELTTSILGYRRSIDIENNLVELFLEIDPDCMDISSLRLTAANTFPYLPYVTLRWNQSFDLTIQVEENTSESTNE